ncbi:MAG: ATP-dependent helicase HrpB [Halioglobus sp.]|nr:ATP-dependent helicase HrpB [Halioglobus sp.]
MELESASNLPVHDILDALKCSLRDRDEAVLQAPPGAGKTTLVPLALLDQPWLEGQRVLLLEPRRLAARAAAHRMAQLLGEEVGQTVGYRIRMDSCVGENTRVEVVTEGILTHRLQRDPGLDDIGLVIFDEIHERNLDSDLCLALCLQGRVQFREGRPLKLLAMSATLDSNALSALMGDAPVLTSEGRQFPVETTYGEPSPLRSAALEPLVDAVMDAVRQHTGSILVFLPGKREIVGVARRLSDVLREPGDAPVKVFPLYGGLSLAQQQEAVMPVVPGHRKIVLATNVAETSLTIEGISVVVDSGLVREPVFDSKTGMTRLTTRRISRASADQREGRAGRQAAGFCYRMWSEEQHAQLMAQPIPEIQQADLAPLVLQLLSWGVDDPEDLRWLDAPARPPFEQAVAVLERCGAAFSNSDGKFQLTPHGVRLAQIPLHPRLAHMLLVGCDVDANETACLVAAILSERNPLSDCGADIAQTVAVLMGDSRCPAAHQGWFRRIWEQARRFAGMAGGVHKARKFSITVDQGDLMGVLIASAYPDRIARREPNGSCYHLSNGRQAALPVGDSLEGTEWLAVADIGGKVGEAVDRIYCASALDPRNFIEVLSPLVQEIEHVEWDTRKDRFIAEKRRLIGSICLSVESMDEIPEAARSDALLGVIRKRGLQILPWSENLQQWRARINLLHSLVTEDDSNPWPDLSDEGLLASLEDWLLPHLGGVMRIEDFQHLDMKSILRALLPWPLPLDLERMAPERWVVPSGSNVRIDYSQNPPVLAVKLQEMFGCEDTPSIAQGRVQLMIHLLSPNQQQLQVTQDLSGFWRSGYQDVKKEMKGRYPKHPWPDDPLQAMATRLTKKQAGTN